MINGKFYERITAQMLTSQWKIFQVIKLYGHSLSKKRRGCQTND